MAEDNASDRARPDASDKARLGLKQTVVGKAKEVAGALTGNDSLTTEGRLEQEQARQTRKADTLSHMAEAESDEAVEQLDAVRRAGQQEREAVQHRTEVAQSQAEREAQIRKQAAELEHQENVVREQSDAAREATAAEAQARREENAQAMDAAAEVSAAQNDHRAASHDAERALLQAEQERRKAEALDHALTEQDTDERDR
ncbi:CsbD family protein [Rhodococcus sp. Q1]|uniref:CsbD family protein n=1 Tax=Rhodococcus sp. Q1 TaxID=2508718 RepID=UPI001021D594|nr:CsbD family protein [Rhodococcus sp. Q1]